MVAVGEEVLQDPQTFASIGGVDASSVLHEMERSEELNGDVGALGRIGAIGDTSSTRPSRGASSTARGRPVRSGVTGRTRPPLHRRPGGPRAPAEWNWPRSGWPTVVAAGAARELVDHPDQERQSMLSSGRRLPRPEQFVLALLGVPLLAVQLRDHLVGRRHHRGEGGVSPAIQPAGVVELMHQLHGVHPLDARWYRGRGHGASDPSTSGRRPSAPAAKTKTKTMFRARMDDGRGGRGCHALSAGAGGLNPCDMDPPGFPPSSCASATHHHVGETRGGTFPSVTTTLTQGPD